MKLSERLRHAEMNRGGRLDSPAWWGETLAQAGKLEAALAAAEQQRDTAEARLVELNRIAVEELPDLEQKLAAVEHREAGYRAALEHLVEYVKPPAPDMSGRWLPPSGKKVQAEVDAALATPAASEWVRREDADARVLAMRALLKECERALVAVLAPMNPDVRALNGYGRKDIDAARDALIPLLAAIRALPVSGEEG